MPYFMNSFRTPKPGKVADVADLVQKSLEDLGVLGIVSVAVSPPTPHLESFKVTAALNIENSEGVDALIDRIFDDALTVMRTEPIFPNCARTKPFRFRGLWPALPIYRTISLRNS